MSWWPAVEAIAAAAALADGVDALDEATVLAARRDPDSFRVALDPDGFALLREGELTLAVRPDARGRGVGRRLLGTALDGVSTPLRAWSHGDHPAARRLAAETGFAPVRALWVMRRPAADLPAVDPPPGVTLRTWRDSDAAELLRVNAAAFADHPEQGRMDRDDLALRMSQPWFDPRGLIVAVEGDRMLGFHWTKQHSAGVGEVYVVAVDPAAQGRGLGRLVTAAGLAHLGSLGVAEILLYVESDNRPAVATYSRLGFTHDQTHVQYLRS